MPVTLLLHDVYAHAPSDSGFVGPVANRYKLPIAAFDAMLARLAAAAPGAPVLAGDPRAFEPRAFLFTVDDGGASYYGLIADRLEALGWRGHCFVSTDMIGRPGFLDRRQIRELHQRGHRIGSHSVTHPTRFSACAWRQMVEEWSGSRRTLEDILGAEVLSASVPGGYYSTTVAQSASASGVRVLFTSEPRRRVRRVLECDVIGRYTIREQSPIDRAPALLSGHPGALGREWAAWNTKKLVKPLLGSWYPRLGSWIARDGRDAMLPPVRKEKSS